MSQSSTLTTRYLSLLAIILILSTKTILSLSTNEIVSGITTTLGSDVFSDEQQNDNDVISLHKNASSLVDNSTTTSRSDSIHQDDEEQQRYYNDDDDESDNNPLLHVYPGIPERILQTSTTPPITLPFRMNCGNLTGNYTEPGNGTTVGKTWLPDRFFQGGSVWNGCPRAANLSIPIAPHLCLTRNAPTFQYNIPVPYIGDYIVTIYMVETWFTTGARRIFNVTAENITYITNMDPWTVGGGIMKPVVRSFRVTVRDGFLTLRSLASRDKAAISAIEIESPPPLSTIRINAGAFVAYNDTASNTTWSQDMYFTNGFRFSNCPAEILNTDLDTLYCSERNWFGPVGSNGTYTIPVIPGQYIVRLMFAELFFASRNQRVFNIFVQNRRIRSNFDIVAITGGRNISTVVDSIVTIGASDPNVRLRFENIIQNAKVSAIEIRPYDFSITEAPTQAPTRLPTQAPTSTTTFGGYLINCGADTSYVDSLGRSWLPDQFSVGGTPVSTAFPIENTVDDVLYQFERAAETFSYAIPVPVGSYEINLFFAETEFNATGQRVFDVVIENQTQTNVDIIRLAGATRTATRLQFFRVVEDGTLSVQFSRSVQFPGAGVPKINAIEVKLDEPHIAHAVATGPYLGTVVDTSGLARVQLIGQTSHTHGEGLSLTSFQWKEGNTVLGTTINTNYSFSVGNHTISLRVADNGGYSNTEVTTVTVRPFGFPAITSLVPRSGNVTGQFNVTIIGSGFNYSSSQINVTFGPTILTGSAVRVINSTAIQVTAPFLGIAQAVGVTVKTPLGESSASDFNYVGSIPISWQEGWLLDFQSPAVGRFGPDQKLYVGTRRGRILKITMNADFTSVVNTLVRLVNPENEEAILGLAFDPMDTKSDPDVYFTCNRFFHKGNLSSSGRTVGGKIRRASGPNLETVVDVITGLPVSDLDHGLNGLEFGDNGELYFTSGSHTNGGIPGPLSSSRLLKENFLSAAVNVAYLSHPDFNGTIQWSAPDDGNMIAKGIDLFAMGLRNPFGIVLHSNGELYGTDNGPNRDYGRMSTGCGPNDSIDDQKRDDKIERLVKGGYYGHPNFKRSSFFNDPRQCVWIPPEVNNVTNYTPPLLTHQSSVDGIMEFHGNHFGGQLRGNLFFIRYNGIGNIFRIILSPDGKSILPSLNRKALALNIGNLGLDLTQAPNGNLIEMRYQNSSVYYFKPAEPATTILIAKTCFPRRGRNSGGNTLSIYGESFITAGPNVTVTVGGVNCPTTFVSASRIDCTLPGGSGTVDIVVRNGAASSTFERGYRYISGIPPPGFVLPVYQG